MSSSSLNAMEVAQILNITKNTVYEMIKRGELPAYKVGRKIRIDRADIDALTVVKIRKMIVLKKMK